MTSTLIVEDDHQLRRTMQMLLGALGMNAEVVHNGCDALSLEAMHPTDLVVLDLGLPDLDGLDVLRRLRAWSDVPVLVVTARSSTAEMEAAYAAGASAFLAKPFEAGELIALAQRLVVEGNGEDRRVLDIEGTTVDFGERRATRGDHDLRLGPVDWRLLEIFARSGGRAVRQERLVAAVAGGRAVSDLPTSVEVAVHRLCRALNPDPARLDCIVAAPDGYHLTAWDVRASAGSRP